MNIEREHLEKVAKSLGYAYAEGVNVDTVQYSAKIFARYLKNGQRILELGCAEGGMTDILFPQFSDNYTIIDGIKEYIDLLKEKHPKIKGEASLFEEYKPEGLYDSIVLGHVLEHVKDPVEILKKCKSWMAPEGQIMVSVPNCDSIHRKAAVIMGLQESVKDLSEMDKTHGHRRVYSRQELSNDFEKAGFHIIEMGGYWLKPVTNAQMEQAWTKPMVDAFMELGEQYPEIAAEIYVVAGHASDN